MKLPYSDDEPPRAEIDALAGPAVVEFGADWCGYCMAAQPHIESAFTGRDRVRHLKIADGPGKPLGRSFRVKLWPTLVFLKDGREVQRLVRPESAEAIRQALAAIDPGAQ